MKLNRSLAWMAAFTGLASGALMLLHAAPTESKGENKAVVIATSSIRGEVTPCG
jgi:hypothetical protein